MSLIEINTIQSVNFLSMPFRHNSLELGAQLRFKIIWEGESGENEYGLKVLPRFQEGNFRNFLSVEN